MIPALNDRSLPGLDLLLDKPSLMSALHRAISGSHPHLGAPTDFKTNRVRYRPGERAIIQGEITLTENNSAIRRPVSLWFYKEAKARKKAAAGRGTGIHGGPVFEPTTGMLMYIFPDDPHVAAVSRFLADPSRYRPTLAPHLREIGFQPELVRYRPGIGTTFRWGPEDKDAIYVKIQTDTNVSDTASTLSNLNHAAFGTAVAVPQTSGIDEDLNAIALHEVTGTTFASILSGASGDAIGQATGKVLGALDAFHSLKVMPNKRKNRDSLVERSAESARLVAAFQPEAASSASNLSQWIAKTVVRLHERPIHADLKVEHLVIKDGRVFLLDLDSFALGDPLYDLAMLDVRIAMHFKVGHCSRDVALAACRMVRRAAASGGSSEVLRRFSWLKACAALQLARHHAQNLNDRALNLIFAALALGHSSRIAFGKAGGQAAHNQHLFTHRDNHDVKESPPCV